MDLLYKAAPKKDEEKTAKQMMEASLMNAIEI